MYLRGKKYLVRGTKTYPRTLPQWLHSN